MKCRDGCGACCIAPSINNGFYGMPDGKPAGQPCVHLDAAMRCKIFEDPRRPALCDRFAAEEWVCGENREVALIRLMELERLT